MPSLFTPQRVATRTSRGRVAFRTLGCKLNQQESDAIASRFLRAGYQIVPFEQQAEAYIINTCTVTAKADRKSRNLIARALRSASKTNSATTGASRPDSPIDGNPSRSAGHSAEGSAEGSADNNADRSADRSAERGADRSIVVVTGCFAESQRQELENDGRTYVVGNKDKSAIFEIVDAALRGEILSAERLDGNRFDYDPATPLFHTRSMVKIQDGCDNFCTFCIIPYVRGRAASRPLQSVLDNVRANLELGYREIVLTGVNMSRYNHDGVGFSGLLEAIVGLPGDFRLRISSLEPDSLDERFMHLLEHPRVCPHLHLCLQSGSDRILLAMRRQYTVGGFMQIVERVRARIPDFNFTTDVIIGFPGETEADFAETCARVREVGFSHIHTFKYSRRNGTRADRMSDHIAEPLKSERSRIIRTISEQNKYNHRAGMIGRRQRLLVEQVEKRRLGAPLVSGYGEHYAPIVCRAPQVQANDYLDVRIVGLRQRSAQRHEPLLVARPV